jgi:hypothetical protein
MTETYLLEPELTKSSYEEETYTKTINNKEVEIIVVSFYRWSEFEIELSDSEKEEILKKEEINLSNYSIEFISNNDCFKMDYEINNENSYTEEEIDNIITHIYDSDDDLNLSELEENDWVPGDVTYGLTCKCTLKKIE